MKLVIKILIFSILAVIGTVIIPWLAGPDDVAGIRAICFNSQEEANKFIDQVGDGTDFILTVPCPGHSLLNQTFPEDESGK